MTITSTNTEPGIVAVTVDYPPVNAIPSRGWFELADAITAAGRDPDTHVVILRAEGRGFNAGVDIKEMQRTEGFTALIDANRGCFAAFRAVYECAVPVIAAVNGFCVGGGIGLVGNSDVIVASDDATFGLPEVERGALGAATHLSRLVPQHLMRRLFFTAATVDAATLHHFGSVHEVVPRDQLDEAALRVARDIAAKDTRVIRAAKEALNLIDVQRVNSSYRMEQGFTFELNLAGVSDEHRDAFVQEAMSDKRTTLDEAVAQLRSGMTIGIGGWGSRRKPMAFVRALLRTDVTDLTVVTYGGPDLGLLCSAGKVQARLLRLRLAGLAALLRPVVRQGPHQRGHRGPRDGRGHAALRPAGGGAAAAVPADPRRAGQFGARLLGGRAADRHQPVPGARRRTRDADRDAGADAWTPRSCTSISVTAKAMPPTPASTPTSTTCS